MIGTKVDLRNEEKQQSTISEKEGKEMARRMKGHYFEASSLTGVGVQKVFKGAIKAALSITGSIDLTIQSAVDVPHQVLTLILKANGVNHQDGEGNTPLHLAASGDDADLVKCLLSVGASTTITNHQGESPRNVATGRVKKYFDETMGEKNNAISLFLSAGKEGNVGILKVMLACGVDASVKDEAGNTALHEAAKYGQDECVKVLLTNRASVYMKNASGETPLCLALNSRNESILTILLMKIHALSIENEDEFKRPDCQEFLGNKRKMFHQRKNSQNHSLINFILENCPDTLKEREILIDLLEKILKERYPKDIELMVLENLRSGIKTSKEYSECLQSAQDRFPWSPLRMWGKRIFSILHNIFLGFSLYFFDVYTDVKFSEEMFNNAKRNYIDAFDRCKANGEILIQNVTDLCRDNFGSEECYDVLKKSTKMYCFKNQKVFETSEEWQNAGIVSAVHCLTPIVSSFIVFLVMLNSSRECKLSMFLKIPLPFLTKIYKTYIDWNKFHNFTKKGEVEYNKRKEKWQRIENEHENKVNLSLIIESSTESSFQFVFQTAFILPTIILNITTVNGSYDLSDLVNWKLLSIILSFGTFAYTSYKIR